MATDAALMFPPTDEDTVPLSVQVVAAGGVVDVGAVGEELPQAATEPVEPQWIAFTTKPPR